MAKLSELRVLLERGQEGRHPAGVELHDALARGCRTASLQATEIAEGVYGVAGFRDLGLILEYVPAD